MKEEKTLIKIADGMVNYVTDGGMFSDEKSPRMLLVVAGDGGESLAYSRASDAAVMLASLATQYCNNKNFRDLIKAMVSIAETNAECKEAMERSEKEQAGGAAQEGGRHVEI